MSIQYKNSDILNVSNINGLFLLNNILDNQLVQTQGYSTEGIGANLYRYDAGSAATVDYGFVLDGVGGNGTGTGTGRFIAIDRSIYDVTKFGAIGNGSADDTAAIQAAIDAIPFGGGEVFFPIGNYKVTNTITIEDKGPLLIYGQGPQIAKGSSSSHSSRVTPASASFTATQPVFHVVNANPSTQDSGGITFSRLMIRPDGAVVGYGIGVERVSDASHFWGNIIVEHCHLRGLTRGISFTDIGSGVGFGWLKIDDTRIEGCTYGVHSSYTINVVNITRSTIRQNTESGSGDYLTRTGGGIFLSYSQCVDITGNDLEGQQVGVHLFDCRGCTVEGNYFEVNFDAAIVLNTCNGVSINGNFFAPGFGLSSRKLVMRQCVNVKYYGNSRIVPVYLGMNRDCFGDDTDNVVLSSSSSIMPTDVCTLLFSEDQASRLLTAYSSQAISSASLFRATRSALETGPLGHRFATRATCDTPNDGGFSITNTSQTVPQAQSLYTITASGGSPIITTSNDHQLEVGEQISFNSTGVLPSGLNTATWYWVESAPSVTTFTAALTPSGSAIVMGDAGTGTHTATSQSQFSIVSAWIRNPVDMDIPYIDLYFSVNGGGLNTSYPPGALYPYIAEPGKWYLLSVIIKHPLGVTDVMRYLRWQVLAVGQSVDLCGAGQCLSQNIFTKPLMCYTSDVETFMELSDGVYRLASAPTGTLFNWVVGDTIKHATPAASGTIGSVCVASGSPGTWKTYGQITA